MKRLHLSVTPQEATFPYVPGTSPSPKDDDDNRLNTSIRLLHTIPQRTYQKDDCDNPELP